MIPLRLPWRSFQRKSQDKILAPSIKRKGERGLPCRSSLLDVNLLKGCVEITCLYSPWLITYSLLKKKVQTCEISDLGASLIHNNMAKMALQN